MTPPPSALINPMARHLEAIGGPIRIAHAEGVYLYDDTGRSWIDCETGSGQFSLGHRHPEVLESLSVYSQQFDLGNHHLISAARATLAKALSHVVWMSSTQIAIDKTFTFRGAGWTDERLNDVTRSLESSPKRLHCVFNVSASEAIESAIKLARGVTSKEMIVCADNSFHGSTGNALAASAPSLWNGSFTHPPGFIHVPYGSIDVIEHALNTRDDVAAVLLEPVAVEAGCLVPPEGYFRRVYDVCRERRVLVILDESTTGLGRTETAFAFAQLNAAFDLVTVGHALGGGMYPMYAACHRDDLEPFYVQNPFVHISTFGGGEVGCKVAQIALRELVDEAILENVKQRGSEFRKGVANLRKRASTRLRNIRGIGLANAVEFCDAEVAQTMQHALFERGVFCRAALLSPQSLLFLPPLTITSDEIAAVLDSLDSGLDAAQASVS